MRKFLLGLLAVLAMLLPMSQSAQARWVYYHRYYPYHHIYVHRHYWHPGYWYAGFWYPGYWAWTPAPVVVVAPYLTYFDRTPGSKQNGRCAQNPCLQKKRTKTRECSYLVE
jgi:hypothetical protein